MNILLAFAITLLTICSAEIPNSFYAQPNNRFYYSYHPFRAPRSISNNITEHASNEPINATNTTVPVQIFTPNVTEHQNTSNLVIQAPVMDIMVDSGRPNISFSFKGDVDSMVNCSYSFDDSYLLCDGPTGMIFCNTTIDFLHLHQLSFDVFSFGLKQTPLNIASTLVKYKIYPFKLLSNESNPIIKYDYTIPIYGYEIVSFMNNTNKFLINNAADLLCFNQLIGLLNESKLLQQMQSMVNQMLDSVEYALGHY